MHSTRPAPSGDRKILLIARSGLSAGAEGIHAADHDRDGSAGFRALFLTRFVFSQPISPASAGAFFAPALLRHAGWR
jgi:hypothetical protein